MASQVRSGFGSDASAAAIAAATEFLVRGVQSPQDGELSILSIGAFARHTGGALFSTVAGVLLRVLELPPTTGGNVITGWSDAFASANPGAAKVRFSTFVRVGSLAHYRFGEKELSVEAGGLLYVALGAAIDDTGAAIAVTVDLSVNGIIGGSSGSSYRLR